MRIMAIDYGDAHTGVAISDPTGLLPGSVTTVHVRGAAATAAQIAALCRERGVEEIVLGHPVNMDGTLGPRSEKARAFKTLLEQTTGLSVALWDERRTTVDAHRILLEQGRDGRERKKLVDAVAASLILEGYLTYRHDHSPGP